MQRAINIAVWTVASILASAFLLGCCTGMLLPALAQRFPTTDFGPVMGVSWFVVPQVVGVLVLLQGVRGRLPGTASSGPQ